MLGDSLYIPGYRACPFIVSFKRVWRTLNPSSVSLSSSSLLYHYNYVVSPTTHPLYPCECWGCKCVAVCIIMVCACVLCLCVCACACACVRAGGGRKFLGHYKRHIGSQLIVRILQTQLYERKNKRNL